MIEKWETKSDRFVENLKIFDVSMKLRVNPLTTRESEFVVLESNDWVNVIPVTKSGNIVMIEQYRHGTDEVTLEIPGGLIEIGENSANAAMRECMEETGYHSDSEPVLIGKNRPNPAFQSNTCHSFIWNDVERKYDQQLDTNELISIHEFTPKEVIDMIQNGKIDHGVILTAFLFYLLNKNEYNKNIIT